MGLKQNDQTQTICPPVNCQRMEPQPRNGRFERRGVWKWAYRPDGDWIWEKDDDPSRFLKGHGPHPDALPVFVKKEKTWYWVW